MGNGNFRPWESDDPKDVDNTPVWWEEE